MPQTREKIKIMRILIAGTAHIPAQNGQAVFTQNLAEGLAKKGHEVLAIFPSDVGPAYRISLNNVRAEAIRSHNLNWLHADSYFSIFSEKQVERIFDSFQPEIVHVQDHFPLSFDVIQVARRKKIRLIGTNHFMPENLAAYVPVLSSIKPLYNFIMWNWMLLSFNRLDMATAQSKASAALLCSQGLRIPVHPVSCGIDLDRFHLKPDVDRNAVRARYGLDPKRKIFLFLGRVDREKRIEVLLQALHHLNRDDIQLAIAGHGADQENLARLARELKLGDRVCFTGFIPPEDLADLLNSIDIFAMPSEAELLSIASLEAMACGRPLLLANAVALPELVSDGVNGYLFSPGDALDAARCMALLADHPEDWQRMGLNSLEKASLHGIDNTLNQYEGLYNELLARANSVSAGVNGKNRRKSAGKLVRDNK
jgi:glycosyltransferase involved in cell wall biosynthesis